MNGGLHRYQELNLLNIILPRTIFIYARKNRLAYSHLEAYSRASERILKRGRERVQKNRNLSCDLSISRHLLKGGPISKSHFVSTIYHRGTRRKGTEKLRDFVVRLFGDETNVFPRIFVRHFEKGYISF